MRSGRGGVTLVLTPAPFFREVPMRRRVLGLIAVAVFAVFGAGVHAAQADVSTKTCKATKGMVEYDPSTGLWTCVGGVHDGEAVV